MPPLDESLRYLVEYLDSVGVAEQGLSGPKPTSCAELQAWQDGTGYVLDSWEFITIRAMSRAFVVESNKAEDPDCPPPYGDPISSFDRAVVEKSLEMMMRAMAAESENRKNRRRR